jgi:hypothetical protein
MGLVKTLALEKSVDVKWNQTKNRIPYVHVSPSMRQKI